MFSRHIREDVYALLTPVKRGFIYHKQGHDKASAVRKRRRGRSEAKSMKVAVRELMNDQKRRFIRQKQKEQENSTTESAKANFRRKPYHMRQGRCGNDLGGR